MRDSACPDRYGTGLPHKPRHPWWQPTIRAPRPVSTNSVFSWLLSRGVRGCRGTGFCLSNTTTGIRCGDYRLRGDGKQQRQEIRISNRLEIDGGDPPLRMRVGEPWIADQYLRNIARQAQGIAPGPTHGNRLANLEIGGQLEPGAQRQARRTAVPVMHDQFRLALTMRWRHAVRGHQ